MLDDFRQIKSLQYKYEINSNGTILRNVKTKKHIKIKLDFHHSKKGYYIAFVNINKKVIRVPIHKVVAECWLGDNINHLEIDHIDRNPHNNNYLNLRYVTHSLNMKNRTLSDRIIQQAKKNCLNYSLSKLAKPLILKKDNLSLYFVSQRKAAEYLSTQVNIKAETIRKKFKKDIKSIYGYNIVYLN